MRTRFSGVLMSAGLLCAIGAVRAAPRPAVVELFTSEGCSSCPPAEAFIGELAHRRDVLALAFHVDYWDDLGWRDRFGIPEATPRQRGYAKSLHLSTVYTPQVVIDGQYDVVGSDRQKIVATVRDPRGGVPVLLAVHDGEVFIDLMSQTGITSSEVLLVAYQRTAVSAIGRGENAGRTLTEYNIVRGIRHLGQYLGAAHQYRAAVSTLPGGATDIAVLVQSLGQGPIVGAVSQTLP